MAGTCVTVLCPNGRRVVVTVTPNTSILQIIEDACKKEGFNPDQYKLKHLHRMLDISSTVRYAGLPNKCQLELVEADVPRTVENVTVIIATDSGERLTHDFLATTTLWEILTYHEECGKSGNLLPSPDSECEPVIVFTMRRIRGEELKTTTLRSLAIPSGKCMLRYSVSSVHSSKQTIVSTPLVKTRTSRQDEEAEHLESKKQDTSAQASSQEKTRPEVQNIHPDKTCVQPRLQPMQQELPSCQSLPKLSPDLVCSSQSIVSDVNHSKIDLPQPNTTKGSEQMKSLLPMDVDGNDVPLSANVPADAEPSLVLTKEKVIKLGSNNAILFSMDDAPSTHVHDEDDTFFELSANEVKKLHQEQLKELHELAEAPIMTQQMREMEKNAKILTALRRFPVTQLRIHFPDDHVIQASFNSSDTIASVMEFIKQFITDPTAEFSLHTRHPPRVLSHDMTLIAAECVPNARVYFVRSNGGPPYLNDDTLAKKSSFASACGSLVQRKQRRKACNESSTAYSATVSSSPMPPATEIDDEEAMYRRTSNRATGAVPKLPKWFKMGK